MNLFLLVGIEVERLSFKMYHIIYNLYKMYIMSNNLEESRNNKYSRLGEYGKPSEFE